MGFMHDFQGVAMQF